LTAQDIDFIKNNYSTMSSVDLAKLFNVDKSTITRTCRKLNIKINSNKVNAINKFNQLGIVVHDVDEYVDNVTPVAFICSNCNCKWQGVPSYILHKRRTTCPKCTSRKNGIKARKGSVNITADLWYTIQYAAERRNIDFNITIDFIDNLLVQQNFKCALTGVDIGVYFRCRGENDLCNNQETTASLDRIDSSKGYTEDNIWWVHKTVNIMKLNHDLDTLYMWCDRIIKYKENRI